MSKVVRERLQQTIQCMKEATQVIGQLCAGAHADMTQADRMLTGLLTETQELAIAFGTKIEAVKGLETQTVKELEGYCECLFHVNEYMQTAEQVDAADALKIQMERVCAAFGSDFPNKKEMVFLPYKASMWDSLESVWKAADADPECEAYVIPIPYYDKNPDGTLREFHYEGDKYPSYVPITDYKEYNLKKRHPDMIYIHNPYDDCNMVTTVDQEYYSDKLQTYTDELVYIPYFVLGETGVTSEYVKKFCLTKGVLNADKVIVQSEIIKQAYVNALEDNLGKVDPKGRKWSEKILGLGSPKIDKIKQTKKTELIIPDMWKKVIIKPDGSWKKIVFYNTSLTALLEGNEAVIKKMKWVFSFFENRKDEVALLWRPHPLIESTLLSMRPRLYREYKILKEKYIKDNWGIYDDSADLDRAIILCDGYYGDQSSVVPLCQKAGKKVMIQDVFTT